MIIGTDGDEGGDGAPEPSQRSSGSVLEDLDIADAIEGHARFRAQFEKDRAFFETLATQKQRPRLLWIGCSDSRVVPAQITGADPGELFEIRNIANSVPPANSFDDSVGAAIAYALDHLGIDDIVVCGHTGCGGVAALLDAERVEGDPHLVRWLDLTRPAHALIRAAGVTGAERHDETAKAHVQFQIDNLMTYDAVAIGVAEGRVSVHGWLYDMAEGRLLAYDPAEGVWRDLLGADEPTG
ncbi:MAG: carbonic anhydrase [Hyphomicrobiaceae bacterium]